MNKPLNRLLNLIHHKTDKYIETPIVYPELHYTVYKLYRVHKVLGIPVRVYQKTFSSLGKGEYERNKYWYEVSVNNTLKKLDEQTT